MNMQTANTDKQTRKDLAVLLAALDQPLDRRLIERGYADLSAFLARPPSRR